MESTTVSRGGKREVCGQIEHDVAGAEISDALQCGLVGILKLSSADLLGGSSGQTHVQLLAPILV